MIPNQPFRVEIIRYMSSCGSLWLLFPPLAVFLLAVIIFSFIGFNMEELVAAVEQTLEDRQSHVNVFAETNARLHWASTVLLFYCSFLSVIIYGVTVVSRSSPGKTKKMLIFAGVILGLLLVLQQVYSAQVRNNYSYIFYFTFDSLNASNYYADWQIRAIYVFITILNILAGIAPAIGVIATGCCILIPSYQRITSEDVRARLLDIETLKAQMKRFKTIIGLGSVLMVTGVLHMVAWIQWPAALIDNGQVASQVNGFSRVMGLYWGTTFSLTIAAFYLTAVWSIHRQAEEIFQRDEEQGRIIFQDWIKRHGLGITPANQLPLLIATLAPLLAEPIGAAFAGFPVVGQPF